MNATAAETQKYLPDLLKKILLLEERPLLQGREQALRVRGEKHALSRTDERDNGTEASSSGNCFRKKGAREEPRRCSMHAHRFWRAARVDVRCASGARTRVGGAVRPHLPMIPSADAVGGV